MGLAFVWVVTIPGVAIAARYLFRNERTAKRISPLPEVPFERMGPGDRGRRAAKMPSDIQETDTVNAIWPDGTTEELIGVYASPDAAVTWISDQGNAW